ncbi:MAG: glycosyltransferase [candidate division NC10 bacterium]
MRPPTLNDYREVAAPGTVEFLCRLSEKVRGRSFLNINSTKEGGGVAEILMRLVPLMNDLGVDASWEVLEGNPEFFRVTKAFHNALQGEEQVITEAMYENYLETNRENARRLAPNADLVMIHDPQPAALVLTRPPEGAWIWRCHIDASRPQRRVWAFLRRFVERFDAAVFSLPAFAQRLPIPQYLIYPSIDPMSDKNRELSDVEVAGILARLGLSRDKPILLQVSRFDRFKDPVGVINAYRLVKRRFDCRLVLAGGGAIDDPEGKIVLAEVRDAAGQDTDIHVLELPVDAHLEINALQRAATVVIQKSTREGFGLTVAEAMWKAKPVIGGAVGGITAQILYDVTGYTVTSVEGAAYRILYLLSNPEAAARIGRIAREHYPKSGAPPDAARRSDRRNTTSHGAAGGRNRSPARRIGGVFGAVGSACGRRGRVAAIDRSGRAAARAFRNGGPTRGRRRAPRGDSPRGPTPPRRRGQTRRRRGASQTSPPRVVYRGRREGRAGVSAACIGVRQRRRSSPAAR